MAGITHTGRSITRNSLLYTVVRDQPDNYKLQLNNSRQAAAFLLQSPLLQGPQKCQKDEKNESKTQ